MTYRSPYLRIMRLHQPTGIWLLFWPCCWAIVMASKGNPSPMMLLLFFFGAILMRGAGCIINDIADRHIDQQVERTRTRPLASGEMSVGQAILLLCILLALSAQIALLLGPAVMLWAVLSLLPVALYPWMKRISWWPQLFLGLTFNWGALMGWAALRESMEWPALLLYVGAVFWTLGYDTIYAHQDKQDDASIGVKSTALRLGKNSKKTIIAFYLASVLCYAVAGMLAGANILYFAGLVFLELCLLWQICHVDLDSPTSCHAHFRSNIYIGLLMYFILLASFD